MAYRRAKLLSSVLLILLSVGFLAGAGPSATTPALKAAGTYGGGLGGIRPSSTSVKPGESLTITIDMEDVASMDQTVDVATTNPGMFVSFPSRITVPAGIDNVSFTVWVRNDATPGNFMLSASSADKTVYCPVAVAIDPVNAT